MGRKIEFTSLEDMFGASHNGTQENAEEKDLIIEIDKMLDWHTEINISGVKIHPFNRLSESKKAELRNSIKQNGLIQPITLRPDEKPGYYEIIAGHNRRDALKELGYETLSLKDGQIKLLDDRDLVKAAHWMLDSNIQREELLPSERANAYAIKYELIRMESKTMSHDGTQKRTDEIAADQIGISRTTLQRYLALNKLIPELMQLTDEKKIAIPAAELIASLHKDQQEELFEAIKETKVPTLSLTKQIKDRCEEDFLSAAEICEIIVPTRSSKVIDLKPIFKEASKALSNYELSDPNQVNHDELRGLITETIMAYFHRIQTGNQKTES